MLDDPCRVSDTTCGRKGDIYTVASPVWYSKLHTGMLWSLLIASIGWRLGGGSLAVPPLKADGMLKVGMARTFGG